jgi:hypothetical protein
MSTNQDLEYYENSHYYIDNAIKKWDSLLEDALTKVSFLDECSNIMKYENNYKFFLLEHRDSIFLFNSLETFSQIVSVCNFHHQYNLLSSYRVMCICNEHDINVFKPPYKCDIDQQTLEFSNNNRDYYDYLGFINETEPSGKIITSNNLK